MHPKRSEAPADVLLHGSRRDTERFGHIALGEPTQITQRNALSLTSGERPKCSAEGKTRVDLIAAAYIVKWGR